MSTSLWRLASASLLCLAVAGVAQAESNGPTPPPGLIQGGHGGGGGQQSEPRPSAPPQNAPRPQPNYNPGGNNPGAGRPQGQGWQQNPNAGQEAPRGNPLQPHPDSVRQSQPPIRGDYRDLQPQNRRYEAGGADQRRDNGPRGGGWGSGPQYRPGQMVDRFPEQNYRVPYRGQDYFYSGGYWYRPQAGRYIVVNPPYGIRTRYLPDYAERMWIGGTVFFVAAGTYYQWADSEQDYVVVNPPQGVPVSQPVPAQPVQQQANGYDVAIYPANGQSPAQLERDRYECQQWASQQSGFDPRTATYAPADAVVYTYRQNLANCLVQRGYGVN
ncbi:DUF6515 family protein [Pseudomonas sp. NPDC007930]|uniref:DUF6515 family protein n=1 Tax=Pseudomonas sp. NPDC007930 TaxID=3364417 RepID=UPI0036E47C5B